MADVGLTWDPVALAGDAVLSQGDLAGLDDLTTAVVLSLFTWRRANSDDRIPDGTDHPQGFWGDLFAEREGDQLGSRLWLLSREKLTQETMNRAKEYAAEALQWMIDDGVATQIEIQLERQGLHQLAMAITIYRQTSVALVLRFDQVWEGLRHG